MASCRDAVSLLGAPVVAWWCPSGFPMVCGWWPDALLMTLRWYLDVVSMNTACASRIPIAYSV
eukprot:9174959-Pyramimonas_sp.AAC.1